MVVRELHSLIDVPAHSIESSTIQSFIMFTMTIYKCGGSVISNTGGSTRVISLFMRDGIFWFLAVFGEHQPYPHLTLDPNPHLPVLLLLKLHSGDGTPDNHWRSCEAHLDGSNDQPVFSVRS